MAEGRCHSCKHWTHTAADFMGDVPPDGWGRCEYAAPEYPEGNIRRAVVGGGVEQAPYLLTRSEFGCVDHEQATITIGDVEVPLDRDPRIPPGTMLIGAVGHPVVIRDVGIGGGTGDPPVVIDPDERLPLTVERPLATGDRVILPEGRTGEVRTVSPNGNCYVRLDSGNTAWIHSARLRRQG